MNYPFFYFPAQEENVYDTGGFSISKKDSVVNKKTAVRLPSFCGNVT